MEDVEGHARGGCPAVRLIDRPGDDQRLTGLSLGGNHDLRGRSRRAIQEPEFVLSPGATGSTVSPNEGDGDQQCRERADGVIVQSGESRAAPVRSSRPTHDVSLHIWPTTKTLVESNRNARPDDLLALAQDDLLT